MTDRHPPRTDLQPTETFIPMPRPLSAADETWARAMAVTSAQGWREFDKALVELGSAELERRMREGERDV